MGGCAIERRNFRILGTNIGHIALAKHRSAISSIISRARAEKEIKESEPDYDTDEDVKNAIPDDGPAGVRAKKVRGKAPKNRYSGEQSACA